MCSSPPLFGDCPLIYATMCKVVEHHSFAHQQVNRHLDSEAIFFFPLSFSGDCVVKISGAQCTLPKTLESCRYMFQDGHAHKKCVLYC